MNVTYSYKQQNSIEIFRFFLLFVLRFANDLTENQSTRHICKFPSR